MYRVRNLAVDAKVFGHDLLTFGTHLGLVFEFLALVSSWF
jgi:hypothetical protein